MKTFRNFCSLIWADIKEPVMGFSFLATFVILTWLIGAAGFSILRYLDTSIHWPKALDAVFLMFALGLGIELVATIVVCIVGYFWIKWEEAAKQL